ncbi:MAG: hypothetical protein LAN36_09080 [Acidobacteriia bacterium]|nr:hypothetical protein [Terriglobia bacterium]
MQRSRITVLTAGLVMLAAGCGGGNDSQPPTSDQQLRPLMQTAEITPLDPGP